MKHNYEVGAQVLYKTDDEWRVGVIEEKHIHNEPVNPCSIICFNAHVSYTLDNGKEITNPNNIRPMPKRGDMVMVNIGCRWEERIFVTYIDGDKHPFICVSMGWEDYFKKGEIFYTNSWEHIKPIDETVTITIPKKHFDAVKKIINDV